MIVLRRLLALILIVPLLVAFVLSLVTGRLNATVLDASFVKEQLREVEVYDRFYDEALPRLVEDYLAQQQERLPENLRALDLPDDPESARRIAALVQTMFPRDFLQAQVEHTIDEVWPWLAAKTEDFELRLTLREGLLSTFGHPAPGRPSAFEQTWRDLQVGDRLLTGLVAAAEGEEGDRPAGESRTEGEEEGLGAALAADLPGATAWLEANLFAAIDAMLPYLVGDSEEFELHVTFDAFPFLAEMFAGPFQTPPDQLRAEGWTMSAERIRTELAAAGSDALSDADRSLALFRAEGARVTSEDLLRRIEEQQAQSRLDDPEFDAGLDPRAVRALMARGRIAAVWGPVGIAAALVLLVGVLGGRRWRSRLAWSASALLVASAVAFALAAPVYQATLGDGIDAFVVEQNAEPEGALPLALRAALLDRLDAVTSEISGHMAATARNWLALSTLALIAAAAWPLYPRRRAPIAVE